MALTDLSARTASIHMAQLAEQDEAERLERYKRAWNAYDGNGPKPLDIEPGQADDNVRLDYAALIVDKGVSFLAGKGGVTFQVQQEDTEPDTPEHEQAQAAAADTLALLDDAWPEEQRHLDFHGLALNGGVTGHAWLRLFESGRVAVLDSANVTVVWNEDDVGIVERYLIQWDTVSADDGMGVVRRKRIEPDVAKAPQSWTIYDEELDDDTGQWVLLDETPWPHEYPPVIGAQNLPAPNTCYGKADLEPAVLDMVEQLESIASDMRRIVRLHGHPIPVILGEEASRLAQIDVAIGELLAVPSKDAKLAQLTIAELTSSLSLYQEIKTALFEGARIPKVALGETVNAGPTTGVALTVEYEPLLEKTETKRLTYGLMLRQAAERVLDLKGRPGVKVTLGWPTLTPSDPVAEATTDESELRMGVVSKQTVAEKRGYDWTQEQRRIDEEAGQAQARFDRGQLGGDNPFGGGGPPGGGGE